MLYQVNRHLELKPVLVHDDVFVVQIKSEVDCSILPLLPVLSVQQSEWENQLEFFHPYRVEMHFPQCLLVKLLELIDTSVQAVNLIEHPKPHDYSFPQVITIIINVINEPKSHGRVEILLSNIRSVIRMYLNE